MNSLWETDFIVAHTQILTRSFKKWTGRELLPGNLGARELAREIFEAPFVVVSHGTEADPVLNYGNVAALALWEMPWEAFTHTPSRLTAEIPNREERARLLETVARQGFIDDYSGIRISKTGRRFHISHAMVWNLLSQEDRLCGQAAMFERWESLQAF